MSAVERLAVGGELGEHVGELGRRLVAELDDAGVADARLVADDVIPPAVGSAHVAEHGLDGDHRALDRDVARLGFAGALRA